eukprot:1155040-Prorocentrum_minimum.AAC.2
MRLKAPTRSTVRPSMLLTQGLVDTCYSSDEKSRGPHLVVVAPHEAGGADKVDGEAEHVVHPGLGGHRPMVAAVLDGEADPPARAPQQRARKHPRHHCVRRVHRRCKAQHARRRPLAALPVLALLAPV